MNSSFLIGTLPVQGSSIPLVSTELNRSDFLGAVKVRWGINRDNYRVDPGLYEVGSPGPASDVFELSGKKAHIVRKDYCMECGACALNCPVNAINVNSGVGCAAGIINGILRNSEPTCGCSESGSVCC